MIRHLWAAIYACWAKVGPFLQPVVIALSRRSRCGRLASVPHSPCSYSPSSLPAVLPESAKAETKGGATATEDAGRAGGLHAGGETRWRFRGMSHHYWAVLQ